MAGRYQVGVYLANQTYAVFGDLLQAIAKASDESNDSRNEVWAVWDGVMVFAVFINGEQFNAI